VDTGCHDLAGVETSIDDGEMELYQRFSTFDRRAPGDQQYAQGGGYADCFPANSRPFDGLDFPFDSSSYVETVEEFGGPGGNVMTRQRYIQSSSIAYVDNVVGVAYVSAETASGGRTSASCDFRFDRAVFRGGRDGVLRLQGNRQGFRFVDGSTFGPKNAACQLDSSAFLPRTLFHGGAFTFEGRRFDGDGVLRVGGLAGQPRYVGGSQTESWQTFESDSIVAFNNNSCFKYYTHYTSAYTWLASPLYGGTYLFDPTE
jgi:hypothetical protein